MTTWKKFEKWFPLLLALAFILLTASNLGGMQNPDELVHRVAKALEGRWEFDTENFDYPSLPKYVMFAVGKVVYSLGYGETDFYVVARFLSVLLGAATIHLVYHLVRRAGGGIWASVLASTFMLGNHVLAINARFAHNDLYMLFFMTLSAYFVLRYVGKQERGWLYASFFTVGLTASSKYNGGIFLLVPLVVWAGFRYRTFWAEKLRTLETLFISAALTFGGFALGTPKALLWMVFYFKRMLPALSRHATFGETANLPRGIVGQWAVMWGMFGGVLLVLSLGAIFYFAYKLVRFKLLQSSGMSLRGSFSAEAISAPVGETASQKDARSDVKRVAPGGGDAAGGVSGYKYAGILVLAILVYDLPIMFSYNYQARFFLPLLPFFAVLFGMGVEALTAWVGQTKLARIQVWVPFVALAILLVSGLRVISVRLLLANDPRIPAKEFIDSLPEGASLEHTIYTPDFDRERFEREHDYPVYFIKHEGDTLPDEIDPGYKTNRGEAGLLERGTEYLVVDSFTYGRCANESVYVTNPVECAFFADLLTGETSYEMIGEFAYELPKFLPQIEIAFVNPEIQIFQKRVD